MAFILFWLAIGIGFVLAVAVAVATFEHLRDRSRLLLRRLAAQAEHAQVMLEAAASPLGPWADGDHGAMLSREQQALSARSHPVHTSPADFGAPLAGAMRRMASPAVGAPNSGWIETEPMVLGGPITAAPTFHTASDHFDPTVHARF